jgi:hypothetical protein
VDAPSCVTQKTRWCGQRGEEAVSVVRHYRRTSSTAGSPHLGVGLGVFALHAPEGHLTHTRLARAASKNLVSSQSPASRVIKWGADQKDEPSFGATRVLKGTVPRVSKLEIYTCRLRNNGALSSVWELCRRSEFGESCLMGLAGERCGELSDELSNSCIECPWRCCLPAPCVETSRGSWISVSPRGGVTLVCSSRLRCWWDVLSATMMGACMLWWRCLCLTSVAGRASDPDSPVSDCRRPILDIRSSALSLHGLSLETSPAPSRRI